MSIATPPPLQEPFDKDGRSSDAWNEWAQSMYTVTNTLEQSGTTANRPAQKFIGQPYFDTTLGYMIWANGSVWKDASGNTV